MKKKRSRKIDISAEAKRLLGFSSLRPGQEQAIQSLLDGHDTLVVQPTGSGKSAIYQIAGALMTGTTVVVSPLIALQKDQSDSIAASDLPETGVLNSTMPAGEQREIMERVEEGKLKYIFLAPEQLRKEEIVDRLRSAKVSLIAIDEAHCVSQWGHDFRPDYLELSRIIEALEHPPTLAMTATASEEVRGEIVERLGLAEPRVFLHDFDRPNISLRVDTFSTEDEKQDALLRRVEFAEKPGIVYAGTHKHAESLASELRERGVKAVCYHGGLKAKDREDLQNRFMGGEEEVIVATNAFGMGVDKHDIRFVYHADVSDSVDAYYQEIGRAGRDGKASDAVLFFCSQDIGSQRYKTASGNVNASDLKLVANLLTEHGSPMGRDDLAGASGFSTRKLANLIHALEEIGAATELDSGDVQRVNHQTATEIGEAAAEQQRLLKQSRMQRLEQMREYAECRTCRREYLLRYFGDDYTGPCGNCDRCEN